MMAERLQFVRDWLADIWTEYCSSSNFLVATGLAVLYYLVLSYPSLGLDLQSHGESAVITEDAPDEDSKPTEQTSDVEDGYESTDAEESSSNNVEEYEIHDSKAPKEPAVRSIPSRKLSGDTDVPKRPMSAFFLWLNENRQRVRDENPDLGVVDITRRAGEEWWAVKDRRRWENMAEQAKKDYEEAMVKYEKSLIET